MTNTAFPSYARSLTEALIINFYVDQPKTHPIIILLRIFYNVKNIRNWKLEAMCGGNA